MIERKTPIVVKTSVIVLMLIGMMSVMFIKPLDTNAIYMNALITPKAPKKVNAYELIVDGETWFILEDIKSITRALDQYQANMTPESNETTTVLESRIIQNIEIVPVTVEQSRVNIVDNLVQKLNYPLQVQSNYIVQEGDTALLIAEKLKISMEELVQSNPDIESRILTIGDEVVVSSVDHYLDVSVTVQTKVEEAIPYTSNTVKDAKLTKDTKKINVNGVNGLKEVTYEHRLNNGVEQSNSIISESVLLEPVAEEIAIGTKPVVVAVKRSSETSSSSTSNTSASNTSEKSSSESSSSSNSGSSYGGVTTGNVSSDYGWRTHPISGARSFHDGIDIANKLGTYVNALRDGTVSKVTYNDSYGNFIVINHGDGLQTYYIHLSGTDVSDGDYVTAGQLIGRMGKSGSATGSHLMFIVKLNGVSVNPWDYL